jgi:hypothetical protein
MSPRVAARVFLRAACLALLVAVLLPVAARAQAAPPMGRWATKDRVEELDVFSNGCRFLVRGRTQFVGRCGWSPSSRGGILTIVYPMPLRPGKVRYSIVWINKSTITVFGDVMHSLGGGG